MTHPTIGTVAMGDTEAAEPSGYLFELFYPGSDRWSGTMFVDHDPAKHLPAEHVRNVRPLYERHAATTTCGARRQGTAGGNDPSDCDWPFCGCDPKATKVIETLQECGWSPTPTAALSTRPAQEPVAWLRVARMTPITGEEYNSLWLTNEEDERGFPVYRDVPCDPAAPQPVLSQPEVKAEGHSTFWIWRGPGCEWQVSETEPSASEAPDVECYQTGTLPFEPTEAILDAIVQDTRASLSYADARDIYSAIRSALCPLSDIPAQAGEDRGPTLAETDAANAEAGAAAISAILDTTASEGSTDE